MASYFKRMKVPKEIKGRKRISDDGDLSTTATSAAVAQNHPNDWARLVRSPLGKVSASAVCESTSDSGLSDNDLISVSVDELEKRKICFGKNVQRERRGFFYSKAS